MCRGSSIFDVVADVMNSVEVYLMTHRIYKDVEKSLTYLSVDGVFVRTTSSQTSYII